MSDLANPTTNDKECGGCASSVCHTGNLARLGIDTTGSDYVVALAGNPNTGKSTIFNQLTGLRQHVGNWAGKTVARAEGAYRYGEHRYKVVDLPGTYSMLSTSVDEEIARDFILFARPDVTVVVLDANRLERNLHLALQVTEITDRVVLAVNLIDEAKRHGVTVDERALAREMGVPVVLMAARTGQGVQQLSQAIADVASGSYPLRARRAAYADAQLQSAVEVLVGQINRAFPRLPNARWVALRLLEDDASIIRAIEDGTLGEIAPAETPIDAAPSSPSTLVQISRGQASVSPSV
ncbi:MAG: 50S ribosome-binding GTPase [Pyrinomonadaceae bacterium MAG19_C2-C3]|nr:50S ribosome-binding GTPase [Pyrinomonadaceae bacterium MAG19_C2-C3]